MPGGTDLAVGIAGLQQAEQLGPSLLGQALVGPGKQAPAPILVFWGGSNASYAVVGDWTGIGIDTPGYRVGTGWTVRASGLASGPTTSFTFGVTGSVPFAW